MATDRNTQNFDAAARDLEIDREIRLLRKMGYDTPGICEVNREITERCRERLIAGKSLADFDLDAFLAEAKEATSTAQSRDEAHRITKALLDSEVPEARCDDVEMALVHDGFLPSPAETAFDYDWYDKSVGITDPD